MMKTKKENILYEEEVPWKELEKAREYILNFPYAVYFSMYDNRLQLTGVKSPHNKITRELLRVLRKHEVKSDFKYQDTKLPERLPEDDNYYNDVRLYDIVAILKEYTSDYFIKKGYSVKVVKVSTNAKIDSANKEIKGFAKDIEKCDVCWDPTEEKDKNRIIGHILDMQKGGCEVSFVRKKGSPVVFNRFYMLKDKTGEKELFWDTIEGKNYTRDDMDGWFNDNALDTLVLSIYSAVAIGKLMECKRVYTPEPEIKEFFYSSIRALESYPFVRKIGEKIGIQPESETDGNSPYFYHLEREKDKFNYLELNYNMETLKSDILEKEKYLSEELNKMEKETKIKNRDKKMEICKDVLKLCAEFKSV